MSEQPKARVYLLEDHPSVISGVKLTVESLGGSVVLVANTIAQAMKQIPDEVIASKANMVLVDNHLPDGYGWQIVAKLHQEGLNLPTIAHSSNPIRECDIQLGKGKNVDAYEAAINEALQLNQQSS